MKCLLVLPVLVVMMACVPPRITIICDCPTEAIEPVCGRDLKTYPNECTLICGGTAKAYSGHCIRKGKLRKQPKHF